MSGNSEYFIHLAKPAAGAFHAESMAPGGRHVLDFYPATANFENAGPDLRLTFDDGAVLVLENFYPALEQGDFFLELPDGAELSGRDVEEALTMSIKDFSTDIPGGQGGNAGMLAPCGFDAGDILRLDDLLDPVGNDFALGISRVPDFSLLGGPDVDGHSLAGPIAPGPLASGSGVSGSGVSGPDASGSGESRADVSGLAGSPGTLESPENDWLLAFLRLGSLYL